MKQIFCCSKWIRTETWKFKHANEQKLKCEGKIKIISWQLLLYSAAEVHLKMVKRQEQELLYTLFLNKVPCNDGLSQLFARYSSCSFVYLAPTQYCQDAFPFSKWLLPLCHNLCSFLEQLNPLTLWFLIKITLNLISQKEAAVEGRFDCNLQRALGLPTR